MATKSDSLFKKRLRQDSSDPESCCQKCDKLTKESVRCQGCKLDYCVSCAKISPTLFECLMQGEMDDFYWSCRSCKTTIPSLDNITGLLKDMQKESNERMTRLESRVNTLESETKENIKESVIDMKEEIISSLKDDINKIVDSRQGEIEDRKRREMNIVAFNLPEHNFPQGALNKNADERDMKEICMCLGLESVNILTLFRLGKKADGKIRPLKIVLDSKSDRKFLLTNAKYIEEKVPEKFRRVIIGKDMTPTQRTERKTQRAKRRKQNLETTQPRQNSSLNQFRDPVAMDTENELPSPIHQMANVNSLTDSQFSVNSQYGEDPYNNTTIAQDETILGGFDYASSQPGTSRAGGSDQNTDD